MTRPSFGIIFNQVDDEALPPVLADFSIGAIVAVSEDANPITFPLDEPVIVNSGESAVQAAMGTGDLFKAVARVNAQLADYQVSARLVLVRVAKGTDDAHTMANLLGSSALGTGIYALKRAPQLCNATPRLVIVPGYTGSETFAVTDPVVTSGGNAYTHPVVSFNPPGAAATATTDGNGAITSLTLTSPGNYPPGTTVTATVVDSQGGTGHGAAVTVSLERLANPIAAALPAVLSPLLAHALVGGPGTTAAEATTWRTTLPDSQRLIPQDDWEIVETLDGLSTEYIDGVCKSLGLAIRNDFQHGGIPGWSWANQPVVGALGVKRADDFSLTDGATDAQELLGVGVGVTVRGDLSDTSLDDSGYVAVSYSNASSNPLHNLYNKSRMYDFINLALLKAIRNRLGKENVTPQSVQNVINDMAALNILLQSKGAIVGYTVGFKAADNTVAGLRAGAFTVYDNTETPAPILQVTINRGLDSAALVAELAQMASETATVTS